MSEQIKDGGSAFPSHGAMGEVVHEGMTLRQYAAIKLHVPESGDDWLDEMIRKSLRDEFAAKAMQGDCSRVEWEKSNLDDLTSWAYKVADAMLKAREVQP